MRTVLLIAGMALLGLAATPAAAQYRPQYGPDPQSQAAFRAYLQQQEQLEALQREIERTQAQIRALDAQRSSIGRGSDCFASGSLGYTAPFLSGQVPGGFAAGLAGGAAACN